MKKSLTIVFCVVVILIAGAVIWKSREQAKNKTYVNVEKEQKNDSKVESLPETTGANGQPEKPITNIFVYKDLDTIHWDRMETEFFSVKFPRELSWIRPDVDPFPYSLITNNVFSASKWFMASDGVSPKENEITILFNPGLTSQGDPDVKKKTDSEIVHQAFDEHMVNDEKKGATCQTVPAGAFSTLQCEYKTNHKVTQYTYYIADREHLLSVSVYAGTIDKRIDEIISQIVKSITLP
jgi:hypothetical protein